MNSIRGEAVALDTNVFIFALRKEPNYPACETLLFDRQRPLVPRVRLRQPPWGFFAASWQVGRFGRVLARRIPHVTFGSTRHSPTWVQRCGTDGITVKMFGQAFDEVETYGAARPSSAYFERLLRRDTFIALAVLKHGGEPYFPTCVHRYVSQSKIGNNAGRRGVCASASQQRRQGKGQGLALRAGQWGLLPWLRPGAGPPQ